MNTKDALRATLDNADMIVKNYVEDLSDEDFHAIPVEGMNPIALQLGHLIDTERAFVEAIKPGSCPPLPAGFSEKHNLKGGKPNDRSRYSSKAEYMRLWDAQRAATRAVLDKMSDADFDKPSPERFASFCPTHGTLINMAGVHPLMHVGQFVVVRRKAGKPVVI
jgi:uncharacterized damage-inducible protein DinB